MIAVADGMVSTKTAQRAINDSDLSNYFQWLTVNTGADKKTGIVKQNAVL
jgi:hypothetical protein